MISGHTMPESRVTIVLVHGANHGGWCWERVVPLLEAAGYEVRTPTLTGLAERSDELTPEVGLAEHVDDIVGLVEGENLESVVLVGHSAGGAVLPGVADRCKDRLKQLVYLDAFVIHDGESLMDLEPPDAQEAFLAVAREQGDGWRIPPQEQALERWGLVDPFDRDWVWEHVTDMPLKVCTDPVQAPLRTASGLPRTFIDLTDPKNPGIVPSTHRARAEGMEMREITTGHDAMITAPSELAQLLDEIASR
jgi:pimeloyl-ACP methyl ester carboxylesterase